MSSMGRVLSRPEEFGASGKHLAGWSGWVSSVDATAMSGGGRVGIFENSGAGQRY